MRRVMRYRAHLKTNAAFFEAHAEFDSGPRGSGRSHAQLEEAVALAHMQGLAVIYVAPGGASQWGYMHDLIKRIIDARGVEKGDVIIKPSARQIHIGHGYIQIISGLQRAVDSMRGSRHKLCMIDHAVQVETIVESRVIADILHANARTLHLCREDGKLCAVA